MGCGSSKEAQNEHPVAVQQGYDVKSSARVPPGGPQISQQLVGSPPAMRSQDRGVGRTAPPNQFSNANHTAPNSPPAQWMPLYGNPPGSWPRVLQGQNMPFKVFVFSHEITHPPRNLPCWTFVSQGFAQRNQPEVVFTILHRAQESPEHYPEAAVEWMKLVYAMAGSGLNLEAGQMCDLVFERDHTFIKLNNFIFPQDLNKWASMRRFGGLVHGVSLSGVLTGVPEAAIPRDSHLVVALTHEEAAVARQFGVTRVIGHVGLAVRWFPHPPFIDRDRNDCVTMADQAGSFRTKLPMARIYGFGGMLHDDEIVLTIPEGKEKRDRFRQHVQDTPESAAMAFECFMSRDADGGFIWKAGQAEMRGYGGPTDGSGWNRINLAYIAFAQTSGNDPDSWSMVEDGYGVILRLTTWRAVRKAMMNMQDIVVNLQQGTERMRFRLEWKKTIYHNPIDGTEVANAAWSEDRRTGEPSNDRWPHLRVSSTVFFPEPPPEHCNHEELLSYVRQVVDVAANSIPISPVPVPGSSNVGRQLVLELQLPKCEGWLKVAMSPTSEGLSFEQMLPEIARIVQPRTLSPFKMQLFIDLWGYQGDGLRFS